MKMQTQLCAICGWNLKEYYSVGDICPCCNNEYNFDDFLKKGEILENYCGGDREKLRIMAPELDGVGDEEYVANDIDNPSRSILFISSLIFLAIFLSCVCQ